MNAPIALFVHARPDHVRRTLRSLLANEPAAQSELYVFADGARRPEVQPAIDETRRVIDGLSGFKAIHRIYRDRNLGLAESIISGVSAVLAKHDKVIVLEDDLLLAPHFLSFMNDGLEKYAHEPVVASIHGYTYPVDCELPETFFLRGADCWGWATWRRAWKAFNPDGAELLASLRERGLGKAFDLGGAFPYMQMLRHQVAGRNDSWAIRWHASCFLRGMLTLYPGRSLVENIGQDGSGTHGGVRTDYRSGLGTRQIRVDNIPLAPSGIAEAAVARSLGRGRRLDRRVVRYVARRIHELGRWFREGGRT